MTKSIAIIILVFIGFESSSSRARSFCSEPRAPTFFAQKPINPTKPFCINEFSNTHTCNEYQVQSFNSAVQSYNHELDMYRIAANQYIRDLNEYLEKVNKYAHCEAKDLF